MKYVKVRSFKKLSFILTLKYSLVKENLIHLSKFYWFCNKKNTLNSKPRSWLYEIGAATPTISTILRNQSQNMNINYVPAQTEFIPSLALLLYQLSKIFLRKTAWLPKSLQIVTRISDNPNQPWPMIPILFFWLALISSQK